MTLIVISFAFGYAWSVVARPDAPEKLYDFGSGVLGTMAAASLFAGLFCLLSSFDRRAGSVIRIDWFMPMIRRQDAQTRESPSLAARVLRRVMPKSVQSDWKTKQRGPVRRLLRQLGTSWLASPVRRCVQSICLVTFCVLFFYTCWPYDAKPSQDQLLADEMQFVGFDQQENTFSFTDTTSSIFGDSIVGTSIFVVSDPEQPFDKTGELLGEFQVQNLEQQRLDGQPVALQLVLSPIGEITPGMMGLILGGESQQSYSAYLEDPLAWPSHYADNLAAKEWIPAEAFLAIDPLVGISTALASRSWVWSLVCAAAILLVCIVIPRGFCGYLCPLGTTIDLFDWAIAGRTKRFRVADDGWWVHIKYYLLVGVLVAACFGVLLSGFVSAIPVLTRGMLFVVDPLQSGITRGWHLVPAMNVGQFISIALFFGVLSLGFLRPRFWCKYVCPSGAVFSVGNLFRATERKVESSCIHCNKCVEVCPFDAIKPDFTTRETDCTMCQTCGGVCPTHAIKFVERSNVFELKLEDDPPTGETALGRRGFLSLAAGSAAAVVRGSVAAIGTKSFGAKLGTSQLPIVDRPGSSSFLPVRPPGSVPEREFLQMCIRCGECFKACPNNVLQPEGFEQGLEGLWSPMVNADWAGCESSCNACGQVCPTGAIRELPLEEKRVARMGLAIVNESTCLPFAGSEACDLCVQECNAAGYFAIEYTQVRVEVDEQGQPVDGSGFAAPVVLSDKCVGCGLCQTRCYAINVKDRGVLAESAIIVEAGEGKEDRLMTGSYIELRQSESSAEVSPATNSPTAPVSDPNSDPVTEDPFGISPSEAGDASESSGAATADDASPF